MSLVTPLVRIPSRNTRSILFAPDDQIVIPVDHSTWLAMDVRNLQMRGLPVTGTFGTFFGKWLLARDRERDRTTALEWIGETAEPIDCEIGFDRDYGFAGQAIATCNDSLTAFVRDERLHIRRGSPDTIDDRAGWEHHGSLSANMRLLCSSDGRYIVGSNGGASLDVYDTRKQKKKTIDFEADGHPYWAAMHPFENKVAVFTRNLCIIDLEAGRSVTAMRRAAKASGEYLPDGTLLLSSDEGVGAFRNGEFRRIVETHFDESQPLRISRDGRLVVVVDSGTLAVYEAAALIA